MTNERLQILARFIRNQVSLADRPPPGCIQLNNDEALLCAEALERAAVEPPAPHRDTARLDWLIQDYRTVDLYNALDAQISLAKDPVEVRLAIDAMIAKEAAHQNRTGDI